MALEIGSGQLQQGGPLYLLSNEPSTLYGGRSVVGAMNHEWRDMDRWERFSDIG